MITAKSITAAPVTARRITALRIGESAGGAAFSLTITGLTSNEARIGDHASIGYTIDPDNGTETVAWGTSAGDSTYGTGASPTDYTAGDEGRLWLTVTDGDETVSRSAPIRYAPGTAASIAGGQAWTVDDTSVSIDAAASGADLTWTYSASGLPAGVSVNSSTGLISGTPTAVDSGTATVTATDQYGRTVQDTFTWDNTLRTQATAADGLGPYQFTLNEAITPVAVSSDFTLNGNTLTYTISPSLPAGLSMSSSGSITGTPTAVSASSSYTVTGQDEYGRETTSTFDVETTNVVPFSPAELFASSEEGAFFDFSDASTLRQNSDGTGAVTLGDPVGYAEDQSGNGNHATQPTATARPRYARVPVGGRKNEIDSTATLSTQDVTVTAAERTLSFTGTGTVTLSGASTAGPLVGTGVGDRVSLTFTPTAGTLTLTVSGSVTAAQLELGDSVTGIQTVTAPHDITEAGVADKYGLLFDGVDDRLVTPSIDLTGTDQATLSFAGEFRSTEAISKPLAHDASNRLYFDFRAGRTEFWGGGSNIVYSRIPDTTPINTPAYWLGKTSISGDQTTLETSYNATITNTNDHGTGNKANAILNIDGTIEIIFMTSALIIDRVIATEETTDLETYLEDRAGVTP